MATYLILNVAVLALITLAAWQERRLRSPDRLYGRPFALATASLVVLTIVFDNVIILAGIVAYDPTKISGLFIARAPIEDFAYALAACMVLPLLWRATSTRKDVQ